MVPLSPRATIVATGHYVPEQVITNQALIDRFGLATTDEWIRTHVGVSERRWAAPHQATSDLAIEAARRALEQAGLLPAELARIILATSSGDWPTPATACAVQHRLGAHCPAEDKVAACSGFLFGLDHAVRLVSTGVRPVLLLAADTKSRFLNTSDRLTTVIFGDGASAAVIDVAPEGHGLLDIELFTDGSGADQVFVPAGGSRLPASAETVRNGLHGTRLLDGRAIFQNAAAGMADMARTMLERNGLTLGDVGWLVPHQANRFIIEKAAALLSLPIERVMVNVDRLGNTVGASVGIALDQLVRSGRAASGDLALLVSVGAGYTAAAALWRM